MDSNNNNNNNHHRSSHSSFGLHNETRGRPRSSMVSSSSNDKRQQQQQQVSQSQYLNERRSLSRSSNFSKSNNSSSSLRLPNNTRIPKDHWGEFDSYKLSKTDMDRYHSNSYVMKSKEMYEKEKEKAIREACRLATDSRSRGNSTPGIRRSRKPTTTPRPSRNDVSRASQTA